MKESSKFSNTLASLRPPKPAKEQEALAVAPQAPELQHEKKAGRPSGKRSNPGYEASSVIIRKGTKKSVQRILLDDEQERDFSELVEELLCNWLATQRGGSR
jgi:hypothetical protein